MDPRSLDTGERKKHRRTRDDAEALLNNGSHTKAIVLLKENLDMSSRVLGADHPTTLDDQDSLSDCLYELGEFAEAVVLDRKTLRARKKLNANAPATLATQHSLANNLSQLGQYDEAIKLDRITLTRREDLLGTNNADTLDTKHNLASSLHRRGQDGEALKLNRQVLQIREKKLRPDDSDLIVSRHNYAKNLYALGELDKALELTNQNLSPLRNTRHCNDWQMVKIVEFQKQIQSDSLLVAEKLKAEEVRRSELLRSRDLEKERRRLQSVEAEKAAKKNDDERRQTELERNEEIEQHKRREKENLGRRAQETQKLEQRELEQRELEQWAVERQQLEERRPETLNELDRSYQLKGKKLHGEKELAGQKELSRQKELDRQKKLESRDQADFEKDKPEQLELGERANQHVPGEYPFFPDISEPLQKQDPAPDITSTPEGILSRSLSPQPRGQSLRPKSNEHIVAPQISGETSLEKTTTRKQRSRSVDAHLEEQAQELLSQGPGCTYSNLCDSHDGGVYDTAASQGIDVWFREFNSRTQSLLAQGRKPLGKRVRIAILDTGIDLGHPDFSKIDEDHPEYGTPKSRVKECKSFVGSEGGDHDHSGHGTHSAALLLKLAPQANVYVARVVGNESGYVHPEVVAKAIMHAAGEWRVNIITMSFGWSRYHPCVEKAIDHASSRQVILCAAASNDGSNKAVAFPANYFPVICVHSATGWGRLSHFTPLPLSIGHKCAVIGEAVSSTWPGAEQEKRKWGTSTSTPILAAIVALMLEFIHQKPIKTAHDRRLQTPNGMTQILLAMSQQEQKYHVVMPWTLLDSRVGRVRVESRILDRLDELFGLESPEHDLLP